MKRSILRRIATYAVSVLMFAVIVVWFTFAVGNADTAADEQRLEAVAATVDKGVTLCYSIEGAYPESLQYLRDNYGISYDESRYIVHYERFAQNVRPNISVTERSG